MEHHTRLGYGNANCLQGSSYCFIKSDPVRKSVFQTPLRLDPFPDSDQVVPEVASDFDVEHVAFRGVSGRQHAGRLPWSVTPTVLSQSLPLCLTCTSRTLSCALFSWRWMVRTRWKAGSVLPHTIHRSCSLAELFAMSSPAVPLS